MSERNHKRVVCHFSCGAASAVATKMAISAYGEVTIYRCDTGSEHPDNERFHAECEEWFGQSVTVIKSKRFTDIYEVFEKRRFLSSPAGASCTTELKKLPANAYWQPDDLEIFGYTSEESHRLERWKKNNPERNIECPLIDRHLGKQDCLAILAQVGIDLPVMYGLGFRNNNCIGCVKSSSIDYWKRVRKYFPDQFSRTARIERDLGHALCKRTTGGVVERVFLDEIEEGEPIGRDPDIACGLFCAMESEGVRK